MGHDVQIDELLSAYVAGDVTPAERAAVEERLANDPSMRQQLADVQALMALLKQAQRPVTAKMLAELKRRMAGAGVPTPAELLSAAATGDLNAAERAAVDQYLASEPNARREMASLQALSSFLKKAELPVSNDANRSLIDRLAAKLPAAALAPVLPSADETVAIKLRTSAPTVRIYAMQESPWRQRVLRAAAAMAAAILLAAGTIFGLRALKPATESGVAKENIQRNTITPENNSASTMNTPDGGAQPNSTPPNSNDAMNPELPHGTALNPPAPPKDIGVPNGTAQNTVPAPRTQAAPEARVTPRSGTMSEPALSKSRPARATTPNTTPTPTTPDIAPEPKHGPDTPEPALDPDQEKVVQGTKPLGGVPFIQNGGPSVALNNMTPPSTSGTLVPQNQTPSQPPASSAPTPPTPDATPPANNSFIAAVDGKLIAAVLRDGNDAAATTPDGLQTIQVKTVLPSDSTITTGNSRVAFVLPGDGRLWVNRHSKVTVELNGNDTVATIESGEISYRAPHSGNIVVNYATGLQANTTGLMDVALDQTAGTMAVYSFDGASKLTRKGKQTVQLKQKGAEVIAKLDLSDNPAPISGPTTVLLWQQDLNVNGEGSDGQPLVTTSKKDDSKSTKGRSRNSHTRL